MKIGICTAPESLKSLPDPAFDYVEANVQAFLKPEEPDEVFAPNRRLASSLSRPVPAACCFLPDDLRVTGPSVDLDRLERYAATAFDRAAQVGMEVIVFGSGTARILPEGFPADEGFRQFVEANRRIAPLAEKHGVTIVIEPLNQAECNFINSPTDGARVVEAVDHPNVRLLVDFFHMLREGQSPQEITDCGPLIAHAHLAENEVRSAPGVKGDDFRPLMRALKATGYDRRISIECGWGDFLAEQKAAVDEVNRQLAES
jgi:sugar phosphate isomerase/epimerase